MEWAARARGAVQGCTPQAHTGWLPLSRYSGGGGPAPPRQARGQLGGSTRPAEAALHQARTQPVWPLCCVAGTCYMEPLRLHAHC